MYLLTFFHQLKRRRLPDVRDSPEYPGADIDMAAWTTWRITTWRKRTFEGLRGAFLFHFVSPSLQISLVGLPGPVPGLCVGVGLLVCFVVVFCLSWGNLSQSQLIPVVDRPCLVLVRQCRKKISVNILSDISCEILCDILSDISSDFLSDIL